MAALNFWMRTIINKINEIMDGAWPIVTGPISKLQGCRMRDIVFGFERGTPETSTNLCQPNLC